MVVEFRTVNSKKNEVYKKVDKLSIRGDMIELYYTDNKTYAEFLTRVSFKKIVFFNVLEVNS